MQTAVLQLQLNVYFNWQHRH